MAKGKSIVIRVDAETKQRIEEAAESQGLTLTTFILQAAESAARAAAKRQASIKARRSSRAAPRNTSRACPSFFRATCLEASRGGDQGYLMAGRKLIGSAADLIAWDSGDELAEKYEALAELILDRDDDGVLAWFDAQLPRCMELIPRRRRPSFLAGVYQAVEDDDGVLSP